MTNLKQYKESKSEEFYSIFEGNKFEASYKMIKTGEDGKVEPYFISDWLQTYTEELEAKVREDERERMKGLPLIQQNSRIERVAHNIRKRIHKECLSSSGIGYKYESSKARKIAFEEIQALTNT